MGCEAWWLWGLVAVSTDNPSLHQSHSLTMEAPTTFPSLLLPPSSTLPSVSPLSSSSPSSSPLSSPSLSSSPLLSSSLSFSHFTRLALAREEERETGTSSGYTALCKMILYTALCKMTVHCTVEQCHKNTKNRKDLELNQAWYQNKSKTRFDKQSKILLASKEVDPFIEARLEDEDRAKQGDWRLLLLAKESGTSVNVNI